MIPFKKGVIERLETVFEFAKGKQEFLSPDGYKIAITGLLGFTPTNWEIDEVFKNQNGLNLQQLRGLVEHKLEYVHVEQYICDIFANFDSDYKGYVTLADVHKSWSKAGSYLPWGKVEEAFREISHNGLLDFFDFQGIIDEQNSSKCLRKFNYF